MLDWKTCPPLSPAHPTGCMKTSYCECWFVCYLVNEMIRTQSRFVRFSEALVRIVSSRHGRPLLLSTTRKWSHPGEAVWHSNAGPRPLLGAQQRASLGSPSFKCCRMSASEAFSNTPLMGTCLCRKDTMCRMSVTGMDTVRPVGRTSGVHVISESVPSQGFFINSEWRSSTASYTSPTRRHIECHQSTAK